MPKTDWKDYIYYILIALLSFCSLCFLPFLGSEIGVQFLWPTTVAGWFSWAIIKGLGAAVNTTLFHLFVKQGKANASKTEEYKKAVEILGRTKPREWKPRSEGKWKAQTYGRKATTVFFTTFMASIGLTLAILTFDVVCFLSYIFTIGFGTIFGFLQQKVTEEYYTMEYLSYAELTQKKEEEHERKILLKSGGASTEEP